MHALLGAGGRLVDAASGRTLSGRGLAEAARSVARRFEQAPDGAVLCLMATDLDSVVRYLGALTAGRPVLLWDADSAVNRVRDLVDRFSPAVIAGPGRDSGPGRPPAGYGVLTTDGSSIWCRRASPAVAPNRELAVMLGTSGSTGAPRLVRQSARGVLASAAAIRAALRIDAGDVAVTALPLHHTYGLSVLHSHLLAGATVVVEGRRLVETGFWATVDRYRVSSLAGVPYSFELLARVPWTPPRNPSLRVLTVSGGRLRDQLVTRFHKDLARHGGRLYVMYGQTEAGPRICVLPPERLPEKLGSVGPPVPGMRLTIADPDPRGFGEVVCHSASVMMGYAETAEDLARGDDLHGVLHTGDLGRLDPDGHLWLAGRRNRIGKAFGVRVDLDAVEHVVSDITPAAAASSGDRVEIWCERLPAGRIPEVVNAVTEAFGLHRLGIRVSSLDQLPRLANGKIDYRALAH